MSVCLYGSGYEWYCEVWSKGQGYVVLPQWYSKCRSCQQSAALSLTTAPATLDINIAHGLLGHPDTKTVTAMAKEHAGWTLTGSVQPCGSCALAKARAKAIPKSTMTKATKPGERLFLDISGPYSWGAKAPHHSVSFVL